MGIDIWHVIRAAATKPFGYQPFFPGPGLGGHCIPIDPFYLTWKAREVGMPTRFIELAGEINSRMPAIYARTRRDGAERRRQSPEGCEHACHRPCIQARCGRHPRDPRSGNHRTLGGPGRRGLVPRPARTDVPRHEEVQLRSQVGSPDGGAVEESRLRGGRNKSSRNRLGVLGREAALIGGNSERHVWSCRRESKTCESMNTSADIFGRDKAIIGMIHVGALPGTPFARESLDAIVKRAVAEAKLLASCGFDCLMIENMHDRPYVHGAHGPETVAAMTAIGLAVRETTPKLPIGVQVLSGGNKEAIAVALAIGGA